MKKVLMTDDLFYQLGADRVEWGQPDEEGFYTPTIYKDTRKRLRLECSECGVEWRDDHDCREPTR